jgi:hypothetical protein
MKRGIIQSRGLGDIVIALPIARYYADQGDEIYWPVCREFYSSVVSSVPWVNWIAIETDKEGRFFLDTPLQELKAAGCDLEECLYLYQFLSSRPDLTDPEMYNILKFDQYKYARSAVPFRLKWELARCIVRDPAREQALRTVLGIEEGERYALTHFKGSSFEAQLDVNFLDPAVRIISIDSNLTPDSQLFDWCGVLEGAEAFIGIDSVYANLVDSLKLDIDLYWIRRSQWDLTPVLGSAWTIIPTNLAITEPARIDPAALAGKMRAAAPKSDGSLQSYVPFETDKKGMPTNFMHAVKQGGSSGNLQSSPAAAPANSSPVPKMNNALDLYKQLGVKY